jgi:hypothetical protein
MSNVVHCGIKYTQLFNLFIKYYRNGASIIVTQRATRKAFNDNRYITCTSDFSNTRLLPEDQLQNCKLSYFKLFTTQGLVVQTIYPIVLVINCSFQPLGNVRA